VLGTLQLWPIVIGIAALPSVAFLIASYWIVETPYYLLRRGDETQAVMLLEQLRTSDKVCFVYPQNKLFYLFYCLTFSF